MTLVTFNRDSRSKVTVSLPRAQDRTLQLIIVVGSPESVLPDVLAIHTIEMIPKSMILTAAFADDGSYQSTAFYAGVPVGSLYLLGVDTGVFRRSLQILCAS